MIRIENGNFVLSPTLFALFAGALVVMHETSGRDLIGIAHSHGLTPDDAHSVLDKVEAGERFVLDSDDGSLDNYKSVAKVRGRHLGRDPLEQLAAALGLTVEELTKGPRNTRNEDIDGNPYDGQNTDDQRDEEAYEERHNPASSGCHGGCGML
jgi:hypothetical protein